MQGKPRYAITYYVKASCKKLSVPLKSCYDQTYDNGRTSNILKPAFVLLICYEKFPVLFFNTYWTRETSHTEVQHEDPLPTSCHHSFVGLYGSIPSLMLYRAVYT
ncbi:hypothetical protein ACET3Z_028108 [Daucus carota]